MTHGPFIEQARIFRRELREAGCFTPEEIAAMLGHFVLAVYRQTILMPLDPNTAESMSKTSLLADHLIAEMKGDE